MLVMVDLTDSRKVGSGGVNWITSPFSSMIVVGVGVVVVVVVDAVGSD